MTQPPLPDLERELVEAARRLEAAAPRRRWWAHGWALVAVVVATAGAGVAVARVAHFGPFSYLSRFESNGNPRLKPTSTVTLQPPGPEPAWQARATVNGLGQLCMNAGPRDPRTTPVARPRRVEDNPPQVGLLCADSDEIAERLVDPDWPGATFAWSGPLDGSPDGNMMRRTASGRYVPVRQKVPTTKLLVYAITTVDGPRPVARWGAKGEPHPMLASDRHLLLPVDKSPLGLSAKERAQVARYPDQLELVLWATALTIPPGTERPQVVWPGDVPPHGVDDATVEVLGVDKLIQLYDDGRKRGWTPKRRHISRESPPVRGPSPSQRRWIAAFARDRKSSDFAPVRLKTQSAARQRIQYGASRRLSIAGGGVQEAWIAPGGTPLDAPVRLTDGLVCLLGAPELGRCKNAADRWKQPVVEAVVCSRRLAPTDSLVWALSPPGATRVEVTGPGTRTEQLRAAELIAIRRPQHDRAASITWRWPSGRSVRVPVQWPRIAAAACGARPPAWNELRRDSEGNTASGGGPLPGSH